MLFLVFAMLIPASIVHASGSFNGGSLPAQTGAGYAAGFGGFASIDFGARVTLVDAQTGQAATNVFSPSVDYISMLTYNRGYIGGVSGVGGTVPKVEFDEVIVLGGLCKSDYVLGGASISPRAGFRPTEPPEPFTDETQTSRLNLGEDFSVLPRTLNVGGGKIYAFCETLQKIL